MAGFDLRKELMEINDKLANLNAQLNEKNGEKLAINYQILHMSLKDLLKSVKKNFPTFENELLAENLDVIRLLSKEIISHCPTEYKEQEKTKSNNTSRYQVLNADNATNV